VTVGHALQNHAGAGYRASDPELQLWVAATLYDTALLVYEQLFGPLDAPVAEKIVSAEARGVARDLLHPEHPSLALKAAMPLNRFLTAAWLPDRIRQGFGIHWDAGQQRRYDLLMKLGGTVYRRVPVPLREAPKTWYLRDMRKRQAS
jgi:uncharacterized protein (DUF2236 family)